MTLPRQIAAASAGDRPGTGVQASGRTPPRGWNDLLFLALIFFLIVAPAGNNLILIPLLVISASAGILRSVANDMPVRPVQRTVLGIAAVGATIVAYGLIAGNPGPIDVGIPLVAGPLGWFGISALPGIAGVRALPAVIAVGSIAVGVVIVATLYGITVPVLSGLNASRRGVFGEGVTRVNLTSATSLIATLPILISLAVAADHLTPFSRRLVWASLPVGLLGAFLAGRQSIILALLLTPLVLVLVSRLGGLRLARRKIDAIARRAKRLIAVAVVLGVVSVAARSAGLDISRLPARLLASIGFGDAAEAGVAESSTITRQTQHRLMWQAFLERPIIGRGAGAVNDELSALLNRNSGAGFPWRIELQYHLLLFEAGLAGLFAYGWVARRGIERITSVFAEISRIDQVILRAAVVGALVMAIVTTVNPYVRAVGQQWTLFLPVAVACAATWQQHVLAQSASADDSAGRPEK